MSTLPVLADRAQSVLFYSMVSPVNLVVRFDYVVRRVAGLYPFTLCLPGTTCWKTDPGTSTGWFAIPARTHRATPKNVRLASSAFDITPSPSFRSLAAFRPDNNSNREFPLFNVLSPQHSLF